MAAVDWQDDSTGADSRGFTRSTYGDDFAAVYDDWYRRPELTAETADFLVGLGAGSPVLELGIGTGRVALELAARGVEVHGIDISAKMLDVLRAKDVERRITLYEGDLARVEAPGTYGLVYAVLDTIFHLDSQEHQLECFTNVARKLEPGGLFVVQASVPDEQLASSRQFVRVRGVEADGCVLEAVEHDRAGQLLHVQHVLVTRDGLTLHGERSRYAWMPELDLMARLAGLRLRERWADWRRTPLTAWSPKHVSVYCRSDGRPGQ